MIPARAPAPSVPDIGIDEVVSICRAALPGFRRHATRLSRRT
jgi:hypothetical protein